MRAKSRQGKTAGSPEFPSPKLEAGKKSETRNPNKA